MKTGVKYSIIALLVVAALVGAYFAIQGIGEKNAEITKAPVQTTLAENLVRAADFKVLDKNGNDIRLSDKIGKPVVINFWATWCGYCVEEMPLFEEASKAYGDKVDFMMVDLTNGENETITAAQSLIKEKGFSFPVYFDVYGEALSAYNAYVIPRTLFVNADGTIFEEQLGPFEHSALNVKIEQLLAVQ